ncbi:MAG: tetratricopeptide repeat protein [Clostridia bacterium]|nr:tetratricopeptide repeat protein [Clostridia bacterium]
MTLGAKRTIVAFLLIMLCGFAVGATDTGRLELRVLSGGADAGAQYMAMATNMASGYTAMLALSPTGVLAADLPAGSYMVVVMPGSGGMTGSPMGQMTAAMPTMLNVVIVAGKTVSQSVNVGGGALSEEDLEGDPENLFNAFDFGDDEGVTEADAGAGADVAQLDLDAAPSTDELISLAQRYHDLYWGELTADERWLVESLTQRIEARPGWPIQTADVEEVTTTAAAIAAPGASRAVSVVLAARAVMAMPDLGLALNNFGAILRLLEEMADSVTVLVAAREADPQSPMVLTNLANSVRDLGDSSLAEELYLEALAASSDFGPALSALGEIYMARRDYEKAIEMMMRGAKTGFCAAVSDTLADALDEAYSESDKVPPLPPTWDDSDSLASVIPVVPLAPPRGQAPLYVPQFGNWDSIETVAGSVPELSRVVSKVIEDYVVAVQQHDELVRGLAAAGPRDFDSPDRFALSFDKQQLHLKLIRDHFWKTAVQAVDRAAEQLNLDADVQRYASMVQRYAQRAQAATSEAQGRKIAAEFCAEAAAFARQQFSKNKPIWAAMNAVLVPAIEDYWGFSQRVLDSIYDPTIYRLEELERRITVYSMIKMAADTTDMLASLPISHHECGNCGGTGVAPALLEDADVPKDPDDKCPFKGGAKFAVNFGPVDYKVACTTVEIGFSGGIAGSLTWDFKQKRVTSIFAGVGAKVGAGPVKLGAKFGAQVTFDADGSVSDISGSASGSAGIGPAKAQASTNGGLVVGAPPIQVRIGRP